MPTTARANCGYQQLVYYQCRFWIPSRTNVFQCYLNMFGIRQQEDQEWPELWDILPSRIIICALKFMPQEHRFTCWLTSGHDLHPQEYIQIKFKAIRRMKYGMSQKNFLAQHYYQWASKGWRHRSRYFQRVTGQLEYKTYKWNVYFQVWIKLGVLSSRV